MQWFNLLSTRTRRRSIFQQNPFWGPLRSLRLVPAMLVALVLACFVSYVPGLQTILATTGVPVEAFFLPMAYGIGMLFLDEARKYFVRTRPKSFIARIAW